MEWISVEDELPEDITIVDLLIKRQRRVCDCEYYADEGFFAPRTGKDSVLITNKVTHWMLPPDLPAT